MAASYLLSTLALGGLLAGLALVLIVAKRLLVDHGTRRVDVNDGERTLEVRRGPALLSALQGEKRIPSARTGKRTCDYCKVVVLQGAGKARPTETPYLTRREIRGNVRLACQVKVLNDTAVRLPDFSTVIEHAAGDGTGHPGFRLPCAKRGRDGRAS